MGLPFVPYRVSIRTSSIHDIAVGPSSDKDAPAEGSGGISKRNNGWPVWFYDIRHTLTVAGIVDRQAAGSTGRTYSVSTCSASSRNVSSSPGMTTKIT